MLKTFYNERSYICYKNQGVCHLLTNLAAYCNSTDSAYELAEGDDFGNETEMLDSLDTDMDLRTAVFGKCTHEFQSEAHPGESSSLTFPAQNLLYGSAEGIVGSLQQ